MNEKRNHHTLERGQTMVLIVLTISVIFGFAALAVDMGQVYGARRNAQAAADAAAMGAAYEAAAGSKDPVKAVNIAKTMAEKNGFNNDGTTNWVIVNNPPVGGPYCGICGDPKATEYYQVKITVRLKPIFAQLVWKGAEQTTVEAIGHAQTAGSVSGNDALLALSTDSDSLDMSGANAVHLQSGNIRSNGGMTKNGNSGKIAVDSPGHIYYSSDFSGHTGPLSPGPEKGTAYSVPNFAEPWCPTKTETDSWPVVGGVRTSKINKVNYYYYTSGLKEGTLPAGIHCVAGGIGKGDYKGSNVLIVLLTGGMKQTGGDSIDFRAAQSLKDKNGNQWGGMAMYVPASNTSELTFGGNADAYIQGTLYAPGAYCDIGGTPDGQAIHSAIICNKIRFHGNPTLLVNFNPAELFHLPPMVELVQ